MNNEVEKVLRQIGRDTQALVGISGEIGPFPVIVIDRSIYHTGPSPEPWMMVRYKDGNRERRVAENDICYIAIETARP